jgi:predicted membrane-bound spermidine synthase
MEAAAAPHHLRDEGRRLFLLGFLGLFLELALIRYLSGNIWNLGYFPNLVLIAVFVGMGLGFVFHRLISARRSSLVFQGSLIALMALVAFVLVAAPSVPGFEERSGEVAGELFFTATRTSAGEGSITFVLWFVAVVLIFAMISQRTAKLFQLFEPLRAYSLDIGGSCAGILAFMLVSWLQLPAWTWFLLLVPVFAGAMEPGRRALRLVPCVALGIVALVAWLQDQSPLSGEGVELKAVRWSPYQKVELADSGGVLRIFVNGIGHQQLLPLPVIQKSFYRIPHKRRIQSGRPPYHDVMVIGAGTGNDVAAALHNGATHVDAVEIDPAIAAFGRGHHPASPWADPRVNQVVDDARAFMTRTTRHYDLIVFALTDSLVKVSPMSQLRLENYVFTEQSIARAFDLLNDGGDLVFYNYYREEWLIDKIEETIRRATKRDPVTLARGGDFAVLSVGRDTPLSTGEHSNPEVDAASDDWPFLYLKERGLPGLYRNAMIGLAAVVALLLVALQRSSRRLEAGEGGAPRTLIKLAFVLMGMAFLLLETKGVIQFSLLFGTTWVNSSLVFLAALLLVLAANATAELVLNPRALPLTFALLMLSCLAPLAYPLANLLDVESTFLRFVLAALLTFSPIYFANLLFSLTFRDQPVAEHLFGWNLLGATLGGAVEYSSMMFGYNALAVVVAVCYLLVFALIELSRRLEVRPLARHT